MDNHNYWTMDDLTAIQNIIDDRMRGVYTIMTGVVVRVHGEGTHVDVRPDGVIEYVDGSSSRYPVVYRVPVFMLGGQSDSSLRSLMVYRLKPDDRLLLLFQRHDQQGKIWHSIRNGVAIPICRGVPNPSRNEIQITAGGSYVGITDSGTINVRYKSGQDYVMISERGVQINAASNLEITSPSILMRENVDIDGTVRASGSVLIDQEIRNRGVNIGATHQHGGVQGGPGFTLPPNP